VVSVDSGGLAGGTCAGAVALHLLSAEVELGLVLVVGAAAQLEVSGVVIAAHGEGLDVVVFERAGIGAGTAPAAWGHEGAPVAIGELVAE